MNNKMILGLALSCGMLLCSAPVRAMKDGSVPAKEQGTTLFLFAKENENEFQK